jgi:hypothetical protein
MKSPFFRLLANGLPFGIVAGLLIVIVRAAAYLFNVNQANVSFGVLNFVYNIIVLFLCLYLGTLAYRKKIKGETLSFPKGLLSCVYISFIAIFIVYTYDLIFYYLIAPNYLSDMLDPQIAAVTNNPAIMTEQKIEILEKLNRYKSSFYTCSANAFMSLGISIIISVITALFTIRKRPVINSMGTNN